MTRNRLKDASNASIDPRQRGNPAAGRLPRTRLHQRNLLRLTRGGNGSNKSVRKGDTGSDTASRMFYAEICCVSF